jgi:cyclic beta-1,2-glucan synthetase
VITGPIRGELLGAEHLADRARALGRDQQLAAEREGWRRAPLLARLDTTRAILVDAQTRLTAAANRDVDVGPAGEWLLDNFHVVQEHIAAVRESLPRGFYRELPELARGPLAGYPRIYELAIALISHTEARIDVGNLDLFIGAFQEVSPLSIGELWAVPAMLRLALIESVRRMALRTVQRLEEVESAVQWATSIQLANEHGEPAIGFVLERFITSPPPLTPVFVSHFVHHLRLAEGTFPPLMWLEQWMADESIAVEDAAMRSTQRLALTQLMMANSITSLRAVAHMDWRSFVERHSVLDAALREDPSLFYHRMTFATRDRYRHVVERIAKRTRRKEDDVAREAVALARAAAATGAAEPRRVHVGYYLVDDGLTDLERATGYRPSGRESVYRWVRRHPNVVFVGGIASTTVAALLAVLWLGGEAARAAWLLVVLFGLIPATEIAISVVNQLITAFMPPGVLPKLNLRGHGVPPEFRTAVVVPTLFGSVSAVREALDNLEVQFLANREAHLHFALLSDFTDAPTETQEADAEIVQAAVEGVRALNARYSSATQDAFYLFHRPRRWNPQQQVWMGWERKRGKLAEFNRFLRGSGGGAFSEIVGDVEPLRKVQFVITLDSDTVLPPDAAPLLIGALAHPLNRAVYDPAHGRVVGGYGILQPRVGVSLPSAYRSRFAAIHSGHPGVDPYTTAVSDVYQDLYGEGSFTGKGIYDVDAFEQATRGRFPENTLLSHDLIEGSYARAGLATDITVYDDYPTRYLTYSRRKHRWIRGDWQLLGWLTSRVPGPAGPERNRLSLLSRWKILDNLRRSIVEIAQLLFLVAGWTILPGSPIKWTLLGLAAVAAPWIVSLLLALVRPPLDKSWRAYYAAVGRDAVTSAKQAGLAITFLPHQAWVSADAILRTLWRLFASRRNLLEWQTASQTERVLTGSSLEVWRTMWPALLVSAVILVAAIAIERATGSPLEGGATRWWQLAIGMAPLILLWAVSPVIANALNAPVARRERRLPQRRRLQAMRYALLHWRFFDRFVTADTNWLAPDNFQEHPLPVVALRTSPTNIGLQLLATVSAYDLGFITVEDLTRRLELAFRSLERMRRFRGHFFNWYDLRDLTVLHPAYISTVDSGNLAGHLIAVRQACLAIRDDPVFDARVWRSLEAAIALTRERMRALASEANSPAARQALTDAEMQLRMADAELAPALAETHVSDPLSRLAEPLQRAHDALASGVFSPDVTEAATEWLSWSLGRIAVHDMRVGNLSGQPVTGREGSIVATFPTPRQLAPESTLALEVVARLEALASRAYEYAMQMDFRFLFDEERKLFAIGYQEATHSLDPSYYDLLASEARLASFVAIAKNDVPVEHWFRLGRTLTHAAGETALVSWSGSMFEYLMPVLVMHSFPATVLDSTYRGALLRHIAYGGERGVPWGISESAYNLRDRHLTYQYRAFGVPDLALKRGLGRELVVAPYASMLAAMVEPHPALENLRALEQKGALGPYGFRDALDYSRPDPGERYAVVRTYMAHHIGMGAIALTNALTADVWQHRFHADPLVRAAELLLHERIPSRLVLQEPQVSRADEALPDPELERPAVREINTPDTPQPHVALLGRLPYTVMISHAGSGYSRYGELAVTRWRADGTRDDTGQFCYLRDVSAPAAPPESGRLFQSAPPAPQPPPVGHVWSAAHQPVCATADWYSALLATDRVTFHRADGEIETRTEIAVMPEDSAEVRRVTVTNSGDTTREIELTSYGEIVLSPPDAERAHPAFANLFVETEWHEWCTAITATRRPRSATEQSLWCVHVVDDCKQRVGPVTCETDRARFIGRGRSPRNPIALESNEPLSGTTGAVLDPIFALRTRVRLEPGQSASVAFTTLVATTRELAFELADRYHDSHAAQRALDLAWTTTQVELRELGISPADASIYQELASDLFYSRPTLRAPQEEIRRNRGSQPLLWADGISGDWPIVLATIDSPNGLPTLRQLFAAHHVWRRRGMTVDLVIVNMHATGYLQQLGDRIMEALFASSDAGFTDRPGGVFIRRGDMISEERLLMLRATARVHIHCDGRPLGRMVDAARTAELVQAEDAEAIAAPLRRSDRHTPPSLFATRRSRLAKQDGTFATTPEPAFDGRNDTGANGMMPEIADNGYGGVTPEGDYAIRVRGDRIPPAPWANVIANPTGGFVITERGGGFTWAENSHFFRLTPWHNDPVGDPASEVLYLHDEESGVLWSATPAPVGHGAPCTVRHGPGTTTFEQRYAGIATHLTLGIAEHEAVKLSVLRLTNHHAKPRRLTLTAYVEWTLGVLREHTQHQVLTTFDADLQAMLAQNFFDPEYAGQVAFCAISEPVLDHTADRREFLGRNGSAARPEGLRGAPLAGTTGAGIDPCAALRCAVSLAPGETREIAMVLGAAEGYDAARRAIGEYRDAGRSRAAIDRTVAQWTNRLSVISVRTPEPSFDVMVNRWTLYQALACRMWARSAIYQSSGAYGFRDQLQDVMAFVYAEPGIAREHILRASGRQFVEGDVQHWWHPQTGRGVRTRFSDDLVWLPYVVDHYVRVTGDASVFDELAPFLTMRLLEPDEHEVYDLPQVSTEQATVYGHCLRALRKACTAGPHGLPLIGSGDWNDGMNRVGIEGRGESVWLAWFLITTLRTFAEHAAARGDAAVADELRARADAYVAAVETGGWDGEWYRRAYFDDGTPLGSAQNAECRIDSIAQSWSVISAAGDSGRQERAMRSLEQHLVREDARLLMLLTPAFDESPNDPGYIKGYLPGVRENGAQYTHAALWAVLATALQGRGDRAFELYQMINPLTHATTPEQVATYKVEPYVVAADVYTAERQLGRGGWTWYTGSASWMYRVGLESILGLTKRGDTITFRPSVPGDWPEFTVEYRYGRSTYVIVVREPAALTDGNAEVSVDGRVLDSQALTLRDDGLRHDVVIGPRTAA